jgi:acyl dehydratase
VRHLEDFRPGEVIDLGEVRLAEDDIIAFARQFDPQPFHIDPERGRQSPFGSLIASGWHTAALFMRLFATRVLNESVSLGSPGVEELRWLRPVRPGDTLRGRFTVLEARPSRSRADWGIVRSRGEMLNQDGEVVMSLEAVNFFGRRPDGRG